MLWLSTCAALCWPHVNVTRKLLIGLNFDESKHDHSHPFISHSLSFATMNSGAQRTTKRDTPFSSPAPRSRIITSITLNRATPVVQPTRTVNAPDAPRRRPVPSPSTPSTPLPTLRLDWVASVHNMTASTSAPNTPPTPDTRRVLPAVLLRQPEHYASDDENDQDPETSPPRTSHARINLVNVHARLRLNFDNVSQ